VCEETPLRHILLALQDQVGSTKQRPQLDKHRRLRGEEKQDQTDQTDRPRQRSTKRSEHGRQVQAAGEATLAQALQGPMCGQYHTTSGECLVSDDHNSQMYKLADVKASENCKSDKL